MVPESIFRALPNTPGTQLDVPAFIAVPFRPFPEESLTVVPLVRRTCTKEPSHWHEWQVPGNSGCHR